MDGGYDDNDRTVKSYYPRRQQFVGPDTGLRVILQSFDADMDYVCKGCEQGFRVGDEPMFEEKSTRQIVQSDGRDVLLQVYLHSPAHAPESTRHHTALPLNTSMYLLASPTVMTTTDGLMEYSPQRRACYFPMERKLRFYKSYSLEGCIYECFTNVTLNRCGCAPIGFPRESTHFSTSLAAGGCDLQGVD